MSTHVDCNAFRSGGEPDWRLGDPMFRQLEKEWRRLENQLSRLGMAAYDFKECLRRTQAAKDLCDAYQPPDRTCCRPKGKHSPDPGGAPGGGDCQGDDPRMDHLPHEDSDR